MSLRNNRYEIISERAMDGWMGVLYDEWMDGLMEKELVDEGAI